MKRVLWLGLIALSALFVRNAFCQGSCWQQLGRDLSAVKTVLLDRDDPRIIYVGAKSGVFKSTDAGKNFRNVLSLGRAEVNLLFLDRGGAIFAATSSGLFRSLDQAESFTRIFRGKNYRQSNCLAVLALPEVIYLGTAEALFFSKDQGRTWQKAAGALGNSSIYALAASGPDLYIASQQGVFRGRLEEESWDKIFVSLCRDEGNDAEEEPEEKETDTCVFRVNYLTVDSQQPQRVFLATSRGVYSSQDRGSSWQALAAEGLLSRQVKSVFVFADSRLYALSSRGIFAYVDGLWQELSLTLPAAEVNQLAVNNESFLYAACDEGLFVLSGLKQPVGELLDSFIEPNINEVQQAAIEYAEVYPGKISLWRKQAAMKALFPRVTAGVNRDTSELWHWESGSTTRSGDDILVRGNDSIGWDVTLTWDFSDLIFNESQTSIDVRSRLMVELRADIIEEVTRVYFERLRVRAEQENLRLDDKKKNNQLELKIRELTALLDGLTGGYFSAHLKQGSAPVPKNFSDSA